MLCEFIAVFLGGGFGSLIRFLITKCSLKFADLPHFGTFTANIFGCLIIGFIYGLITKKTNFIPQHIKIFITIGFLGGLTTFSTFNFEVFELIKTGKIINRIFYLSLTCLLGLLATLLGLLFANKL